MGPDTYFVPKHGKKQRKKVADADDVVHIGKPLRRTRVNGRNEATKFFEPCCEKGAQLYVVTDALVTCIICLGMT